MIFFFGSQVRVLLNCLVTTLKKTIISTVRAFWYVENITVYLPGNLFAPLSVNQELESAAVCASDNKLPVTVCRTGAAGSGVCRRPVYGEPRRRRLVPEPGLHRSCDLPEGPRGAGLPEQPGPAEEPPPAAAHRVTPPGPFSCPAPSTSHFHASSSSSSSRSVHQTHRCLCLTIQTVGCLLGSERLGCRRRCAA